MSSDADGRERERERIPGDVYREDYEGVTHALSDFRDAGGDPGRLASVILALIGRHEMFFHARDAPAQPIQQGERIEGHAYATVRNSLALGCALARMELDGDDAERANVDIDALLAKLPPGASLIVQPPEDNAVGDIDPRDRAELLRIANEPDSSPSAPEDASEGLRDRLAAAVAFAAEAHAGQVYRGYNGRPDEPYILHPLRVMAAVPASLRVVAVLHDCLEDAGRSPEWLTQEERGALVRLTRIKGEAYEDYIAGIAKQRPGHPARAVKIADLRDNLAHDPPPHLRERYEAALKVLAPSEPVDAEREKPEEVRLALKLAFQAQFLRTHAGMHTATIKPKALHRIADLLDYAASALRSQGGQEPVSWTVEHLLSGKWELCGDGRLTFPAEADAREWMARPDLVGCTLRLVPLYRHPVREDAGREREEAVERVAKALYETWCGSGPGCPALAWTSTSQRETWGAKARRLLSECFPSPDQGAEP